MSLPRASFPLVSADFVADLYHRYLRDPKSIDPSWIPYLHDFYKSPARIGEGGLHRLSLVAASLIESYRQRGHLAARLDPLGLWKPPCSPELSRAVLGLDETMLDEVIELNGAAGLDRATIRELNARLQEIYCSSIGFDLAHVSDGATRSWFFDIIEASKLAPDETARTAAAMRLIEADELERFMNLRFVGKKRFGAEGAEGLLAWFDATLARCVKLGVEQVIIGGTARGRLNLMANIVGKPLVAILHEMKGNSPFPASCSISGDVTYHLGYAGERTYDDRTLKVLCCHNPSHLEAINTVALGRVRAHQRRYPSHAQGRKAVLGLLFHTDAAFAGQGVVAEALQLSRIPAYATGGTIHVVINNQVGFTTDPEHGRSSVFCTDIAKTIAAPVLHVNGDDADAVVRTAWIAAEYRQRFQSDIVVDLVCYRRRGHNELDEPLFTQPLMYQRIGEHQGIRERYLARLASDLVLATEAAERLSEEYRDRLEAAFQAAKSYRSNHVAWPDSDFQAETATEDSLRELETGVAESELQEIGVALSRAQPGVVLNPKVARHLGERAVKLQEKTDIPWALGEALAFATLACDGTAVRLSGQDTVRGAFSQRHLLVFDQNTGARCEPFNHIRDGQARCDFIDSPLSEYGVLGFEYGYSVDATDSLVVWEAQFGDFANVAQVIIDQFIASAEDKWLQRSGLVMLLPHGLEGQGPEHSSARVERFLQLCGGNNMTVANCSTPANLFHLLRRQGRMSRRRPLVVFTPKSLLRNRKAVSRLAEFGIGTGFLPVIGSAASPQSVRRVVLCSGKFYYDLLAAVEQIQPADVAIVRVEQLYPFPEGPLRRILEPYRHATFVWAQEEPRNMGAWSYLDRQLEGVLRAINAATDWPQCVSRPINASTSIGTTDQHNVDQAALVATALGRMSVSAAG